MDADEVLENWSDFESEGSDVSSDESEESEESEEESSSDEEPTAKSYQDWTEVPGL